MNIWAFLIFNGPSRAHVYMALSIPPFCSLPLNRSEKVSSFFFKLGWDIVFISSMIFKITLPHT